MAMTELDKRLGEAKEARQRFEYAYRKARQSHRIDDYEDALTRCATYANILDGIIAAHVRIVLTGGSP